MSLTRDLALQWCRDRALGMPEEQAEQLRAQPAFVDRANAMWSAFSGPLGDLALETILDATLFQPPVDREQPNEHAYLRHAQQRVGENKVAAMILFYLDQADRSHSEERKDPHDRFTEHRGLHPDVWGGNGSYAGGGDDLLDSGPGRDLNITG